MAFQTEISYLFPCEPAIRQFTAAQGLDLLYAEYLGMTESFIHVELLSLNTNYSFFPDKSKNRFGTGFTELLLYWPVASGYSSWSRWPAEI
jgi:hypothetical protein